MWFPLVWPDPRPRPWRALALIPCIVRRPLLFLAGPREVQTPLVGREVWAMVVLSPSPQTPQATFEYRMLWLQCRLGLALGRWAHGWISSLSCWVLGCSLLASVAAGGWTMGLPAGPSPGTGQLRSWLVPSDALWARLTCEHGPG